MLWDWCSKSIMIAAACREQGNSSRVDCGGSPFATPHPPVIILISDCCLCLLGLRNVFPKPDYLSYFSLLAGWNDGPCF